MQHKKLKRIFLIRHGESYGNRDFSIYQNLPNPMVPLTPTGKEQAVLAGMALADFIQRESQKCPALLKQKFRIWYSPFLRTTQTKTAFLQGFLPCRHLIDGIYPEPLLIERQFGLFEGLHKAERQQKYPETYAKMQKYIEHGCGFYAKPPQGESQFDLQCRVKPFKNTLWRDALNEKNPIENVILISHGATINAFIMDFLHKDIEWLNTTANPNNCSIQLIEQGKNGRYETRFIFDGYPKSQKKIEKHLISYPIDWEKTR